MATYTFNVKKEDGSVVKVTIEAANYKQARQLLGEQHPPVIQKVAPGTF